MNNSEKLILFRTDGGDVIGYGHIMRDTALAHELIRRGYEVKFVSRQLDGAGIRTLSKNGFDPVVIPENISEEMEASWVIDKIKMEFGIPVFIIIDCYHLPESDFKTYRNTAPIMATDVFGGRDYRSVNIVYNGYANAGELDYSSLSADGKRLLGINYTLVRDDVYAKRYAEKLINKKVKTILVNGGGVDEHDVTGRVADSMTLLDPQDLPETAYFVTGIKYPFSDRLDSKLKKLPFAKRLIQPANWLELLRDVDLAITAGGSTIYEAAIFGTPNLALVVEENQIGSALVLEKKGIIQVPGWLKELNDSEIIASYKKLVNDYDLRLSMSKRGLKILDGQAAKRVADEIEKFIP